MIEVNDGCRRELFNTRDQHAVFYPINLVCEGDFITYRQMSHRNGFGELTGHGHGRHGRGFTAYSHPIGHRLHPDHHAGWSLHGYRQGSDNSLEVVYIRDAMLVGIAGFFGFAAGDWHAQRAQRHGD